MQIIKQYDEDHRSIFTECVPGELYFDDYQKNIDGAWHTVRSAYIQGYTFDLFMQY